VPWRRQAGDDAVPTAKPSTLSAATRGVLYTSTGLPALQDAVQLYQAAKMNVQVRAAVCCLG